MATGTTAAQVAQKHKGHFLFFALGTDAREGRGRPRERYATLLLYRAVFKAPASPTQTRGTTHRQSRITCTPPPTTRPGETSPRAPRALCPLCRRQQHTAKGTGTPTSQNLAVQKRGRGLLGRAHAQGSLRERSHPEGRNSSRRARPDLPSHRRADLTSP